MSSDAHQGRAGVSALIRRASGALVEVYNRLEVHVQAEIPDTPCLIVGNHGFGTLTDLNVLATFAALDRIGVTRDQIVLVHQLAWTFRLGAIVEAFGGRPAGRETALAALAEGHHVVVFPGGDTEAGKAWRDRNTVSFHGRSGFASIAREADVPVVPIVTAGAGDTLYVATDGARIAGALRLPTLFRYNVAPVSLSIPWGISVGIAGLLPYLPLPTKLDTTVLAPLRPDPDEPDSAFALRVEHLMQRAMDGMTEHRRPILGQPRVRDGSGAGGWDAPDPRAT